MKDNPNDGFGHETRKKTPKRKTEIKMGRTN
jgi:hypothetical protein